MENLIAKRYVDALVKAVGDDRIEEMVKVLAPLSEAFKEEKFVYLLHTPELSKEKKLSLLLSLLQDQKHKEAINLIKTLAMHRRFALIPAIVYQLQKERQRRMQRYEGYIQSQHPIEKKLVEALQKALSDYTKATILLSQRQSEKEEVKVVVEDLGLEASFSKTRVASDMIAHILKAL